MFKLDLEKGNQWSYCQHPLDHRKSKRIPEKHLLYWLHQSLWLYGSQQIVENSSRNGVTDHPTCLLRNLYAGQVASVRTGHGTMAWFQIGKGVFQGYILSLCLWGFPGSSAGKDLPVVWEIWVWPLGWEDPLKKGTATHSSTLAWRITWTVEPRGLQSMRLQIAEHNWVTFTSLRVEYIMWNVRLDKAQAGINIARRTIDNLRYADGTPLWQKVKN